MMARRRFGDVLKADLSQAESPKVTAVPATKIGQKPDDGKSIQRDFVHEVDTKLCKTWSFHNRDDVWLTVENSADLIESIRLHGQRIPAIARKINKTEDGVEYEIIAGCRRFFACRHLRIKIKLKVVEIDDRNAAIVMDLENKDRSDISDFERARSYRAQFVAGVFDSQMQMCEAYGISKAKMSKMLKSAELADHKFICKRINDVRKISMNHAYRLATLMSDEEKSAKIETRIYNIEKRSIEFPSDNHLLKDLIDSATEKSRQPTKVDEIVKDGDKSLFRYQKDKNGTVKLTMNADAISGNPERIMEKIKEILVGGAV